jgi:hypothetical protein
MSEPQRIASEESAAAAFEVPIASRGRREAVPVLVVIRAPDGEGRAAAAEDVTLAA